MNKMQHFRSWLVEILMNLESWYHVGYYNFLKIQNIMLSCFGFIEPYMQHKIKYVNLQSVWDKNLLQGYISEHSMCILLWPLCLQKLQPVIVTQWDQCPCSATPMGHVRVAKVLLVISVISVSWTTTKTPWHTNVRSALYATVSSETRYVYFWSYSKSKYSLIRTNFCEKLIQFGPKYE